MRLSAIRDTRVIEEVIDELLVPVDATDADDDDTDEEDDDPGIYTDEDFWEALDLIDSARYQIKMILRHSTSIHQGRKQSAEKVADELKQFMDHFLPNPMAPSEPDVVEPLPVVKMAAMYWECYFCEVHNPSEEAICRGCARMSVGAEHFEGVAE